MAIDLLHTFLQRGQAVANQNKSDALSQTGQAGEKGQQLARAVQALQAGQTIQGEVLSVKGENVQLALLNQLVVEARLEQSIHLTPGSLMAFQVKSNSSAGLSLMPLFTNTAVDPNALKALEMAGIPLNDRTVEMVKNLMQKGLPIDRQSLQDVYRDVVAHKDAPVSDILALRQLKLPISEQNLGKLPQFMNNQHFFGQTFSDIGKAIGQQISTWIGQGNAQQAISFLQSLKDIFIQGNPQTPLPSDPAKAAGTEKQQLGQLMAESGELLPTEEKAVIRDEGMVQTKMAAAEGSLAELAKEGQTTATTAGKSGLDQLISLLSSGSSQEKTAAAFQKLWKNELQPQLMMNPEQVGDKEQVQEYYRKLGSQLQKLGELAERQAGQDSVLGKAVQNTSSGLEFMNQMNQMHAYVQLPLKMANREAKGELYVFTNKRSLAKQDGKVTALLHLDMEYLGKMDVYVALENQKVGTQFYLEKEEYLDFLEEHMDLLTSRLQKRGYECSVKTSLRREEGESSVLEKIVMDQSQPILLSTQAFDMRA